MSDQNLNKRYMLNQSSKKICVEYEHPKHLNTKNSSVTDTKTEAAQVEVTPNRAIELKKIWAKVPEPISLQKKNELLVQIKDLLLKKNAVLVSHYYVSPELQDLASQTGGIVSDSLEMARFGKTHEADTLIVAGVRFMGETAKILSPGKIILMPDQSATCSLDLGCPADEFYDFCQFYSGRTIVVYANTSAAVKARADWVVTSSCALEIVSYLKRRKEKILWAPDRHLGNYIRKKTGADIVMWEGSCIVHDEFKADELAQMKRNYPEAKVLVHPESPDSVLAQADIIGSTSAILKAAKNLQSKVFIVATDNGMMHSLRKNNPEKTFLEAPTAGQSATCKSCAHCPWMAMNDLKSLFRILTNPSDGDTIQVEEKYIVPAQKAIQKMLAFTQNSDPKSQNDTTNAAWTPDLGSV